MSHSGISDFEGELGCRFGANLEVPGGRCFIALLDAFRASGGTASGEIVGRLLEERQVGNALGLAKLVYPGHDTVPRAERSKEPLEGCAHPRVRLARPVVARV
jgi:hypothetical protein